MTEATQLLPDPAVVPDEICDAIRAAREIALFGHITPDADTICSAGALWLALPELGKRPHLHLPAGSVSRSLRYLLDFAGLQPCNEHDLASADLVIALDTAKARRLNAPEEWKEQARVPVVNLDHHATNTRFGKWNWIVGHSSSTSELVHAVITALGCQVTPTLATLLYAGIHTDTQGFSLSNTGPNSLKVGHALALAGANIPEVCERMHRSLSHGEFELLGVIYRNTRLIADGRIAYSTATHEEITGAGCTAEDIDDQVEVPRSIEGISLAILFTEGVRGRIRMNFRGEGGISVLPLAQEFGGGGHHASAGAILDGTMEEVTQRVLPVAQTYAAQLAQENTA